jgi:hypothetical protein
MEYSTRSEKEGSSTGSKDLMIIFLLTLCIFKMNEPVYSQSSGNEATAIAQIEKKIHEQIQNTETYEVRKTESVWPEEGSGIESESVEHTTFSFYSDQGRRQVITIHQDTVVPGGPFYFYQFEEHYYQHEKLHFIFARKSSPIRYNSSDTVVMTEYKIYFPEPLSLDGNKEQNEPIRFVMLQRSYKTTRNDISFDRSKMGYGRFIDLFPEHSFERMKITKDLKRTSEFIDAVNRDDLLLHRII